MDYTQYKQLELRRKFWKLMGAEISIFDPSSETLVGFIKMKAWKLREDIRIYTDKTLSTEVVAIHARQIIDFGATYDVTDSANGQPLFSLRRKGLRSTFVRDHWDILDPAGTVVGQIEETSGWLALARRWLGLISDIFELVFAFVVESYEVRYGAAGVQPEVVAQIMHRKNPFIVKMSVDSSMAPAGTDPKIALVSAAMLSIMDASKNN